MAYSAEHTLAPPESRAAAHWCERTMLATLDGSSSSAAQEQTLGGWGRSGGKGDDAGETVVGVVCFQGGFQGESCVVMIQLPLHVLILDFFCVVSILDGFEFRRFRFYFFSQHRGLERTTYHGTPPLEL
jgi:hypothetical protein